MAPAKQTKTMRKATLPAAGWLSMWVGPNAAAQQETAAKPRAADQSGQNSSRVSIVKGRALYEDSGQPAPRERVQLVAIELLGSRRGRIPKTMTDAQGGVVFLHSGAGADCVVSDLSG